MIDTDNLRSEDKEPVAATNQDAKLIQIVTN